MSQQHVHSRLAVPALFALVVAIPGIAPAFASPPPGPLAISSETADPFADCTTDFPDLQPGTNYPNSELEPTIAVNPADNSDLVAAWQQDRWSDAASRGIVVATSHDGGATWATVTSTKTSFCTGGTAANGGDMFRASNPWVTMGPHGTAYLITVDVPDFNAGAVLVSRSADRGATWSDPTILQSETDNAMNDKPTITADPNSANVYAVWTRNEFPTEQAAPNAADHAAASRGPVWFARTTDDGATWQQAHEIFDPGQQNGTLDHQILVLPADSPFRNEIVDVF